MTSAAELPLTTVMMPAYDAEATIRESIASALGQTEPRLEVVVVDDGSRVSVAEVLSDITDPRLRVLRHRRNRGPSAARNTALAAARAPLVSQLDADDLWEPDYLESVLPRFDDPRVGLVYANATILGHPEGHDTYIFDPSPHPIDRFPKLAEKNPVPALTATMRRDAVLSVGGYARWLWLAQDYHLYLKLAAAGWRFAYVDRKVARFRWPEPGRGRTYDWRRHQRYETRMWIAFALRHPLTPGPRRQVRMRLSRSRAVGWLRRARLPRIRRRCPCCGGRFAEFEPYGRPLRPNARCPGCGSLERHRELCARLDDLIDPGERVLHFAPEPFLERILRPRQAGYVTTDIEPQADVQADITALPFGDEEFDVIVISHVLEHVPDDRAALRELRRVIRPGGRALMQIPTPPHVKQTIEDRTVTDPAERLRLFGQEDHVRIYAKEDFRARVTEAGFDARVIRTPSGRDIFVCSRPTRDRA